MIRVGVLNSWVLLFAGWPLTSGLCFGGTEAGLPPGSATLTDTLFSEFFNIIIIFSLKKLEIRT